MEQPLIRVVLSASDANRFWGKVDKTEGCWLWLGATRGGYGRFRANGILYSAHRLAWELIVGPLPAKAVLDHGEVCSNRRCVRPDHLEIVPLSVNTARSNSARAWACHHPKVLSNIFTTRSGTEGCLICRATRRRQRRG